MTHRATDPLVTAAEWLRDIDTKNAWQAYADKRRKEFADAGCTWPEPAMLNAIVAAAIMAPNK